MGKFGVGIKVEIKIIQYVCIHNLYKLIKLHSSLLGLTIDWKIEDSDGS